MLLCSCSSIVSLNSKSVFTNRAKRLLEIQSVPTQNPVSSTGKLEQVLQWYTPVTRMTFSKRGYSSSGTPPVNCAAR